MDLRIGVTHSPRELMLEMADDADLEQLKAHVASALADDDNVLWLTDRKGREVGVPSGRVAYVEIVPQEERRIGFGG